MSQLNLFQSLADEIDNSEIPDYPWAFDDKRLYVINEDGSEQDIIFLSESLPFKERNLLGHSLRATPILIESLAAILTDYEKGIPFSECKALQKAYNAISNATFKTKRDS